MSNIGLFKELSIDEVVLFESKITTPVIFTKEAELKKMFGTERKEVPIAYSMSNIYLTNERLMFLILYQLEASSLADEKQPKFSGISGTWFEMPVSSVNSVDIRPLILKKDKNIKKLLEWGLLRSEDEPCVELIYDEKVVRGRSKDYLESMLKMGGFSKMFKEVLSVKDKLFIVGRDAVTLAPTINNLVTKSDASKKAVIPPPSFLGEESHKIFCATCKQQAEYIEENNRYYCHNCEKYLTKKARPPPP